MKVRLNLNIGPSKRLLNWFPRTSIGNAFCGIYFILCAIFLLFIPLKEDTIRTNFGTFLALINLFFGYICFKSVQEFTIDDFNKGVFDWRIWSPLWWIFAKLMLVWYYLSCLFFFFFSYCQLILMAHNSSPSRFEVLREMENLSNMSNLELVKFWGVSCVFCFIILILINKFANEASSTIYNKTTPKNIV